jgi:DNA-binding NarL/FixJ family response regulator
MNVLLLEPFTELRVMLRGVLKAIGVDKLYEPRSSLEGMQILLGADIDLLITAQGTQPFNGVLSIKMIRFSKEDKIRHLRTILCADGYDESLCKRAIDEGTDVVLRKPFSADDVRSIVMRVINNRQPFLETPVYTGPCRRNMEITYKHADRRNPMHNPGQGDYKHSLSNIVQRILNTREKAAKARMTDREKELQQRGVIIEGGGKFEEASLYVESLEVGMVITRPISTNTDMLVLPNATVLSDKSINRLRDLVNTGRIEDEIWVQKDVIKETANPNS